ncbi:MAG: ABC transporter substrate-binding protein [Steroidobacteraceae bacterium]
MRRGRVLQGIATAAVLASIFVSPALAASWQSILAQARGQTVYFDAWAGDARMDAYIAWVGQQVAACCDVTLRQVPLEATSQAVSQVIAEKAAGDNTDGTVDLIWINGPNFYALKRRGLLYGPFTQQLPNYALVNTRDPSNLYDFTVAVAGYESPWRRAQLVFVYNSAYVKHVPLSIRAFPAWAKQHPGRFTFPQVQNFLGVAFLEQALYALTPDPAVLLRPVRAADFAQVTAPLWAWYQRLRPYLWRHGREFPASGPAERELLEDGEIDMMPSFNPTEAAADVEAGLLPRTVRTVVLAHGTIGNTSFVAIPYNSPHKAGAMVVANFLLSPAAQARAGNIRYLGGPTVLDLAKLSPAQRARFTSLPASPWVPRRAALQRVLAEPHPSWARRLAEAWERRYTP